MQLRRGSRFWMVLMVLSTASATARAQGFGLNEISTCGLGRGYAAVATGCHDASAIYWNPAAVTTLSGWSWSVGGAIIALNGKFVQDTTFKTFDADVSPAFVPHGFVNYHDPSSKWAFGGGVYVPYGLTSQWHTDFPGRFEAQKASLQTIYIQPNVAYQINSNWSVGGGPIIGHSSVELIQAIDLSQQALPITVGGQTITFAALGIAQRTEFATARLKGDAWGYGLHIGVQGKLSPDWTVGARYMTQISYKYDDADATFTQVATNLIIPAAIPNPANPAGPPIVGAGAQVDTLSLLKAAFGPGGPLSSQKVSTKINHPAQFQVGFAYTGFQNWELEADYALIAYSSFKNLPITFSNPNTPSAVLIEEYNNSSALRLGAEYKFANTWHVRGGFSGVAAAAPDATVTPLLPEQDRANYSLGFTTPAWHGFVVDGGYVLVTTPGRRGRIVERTAESQTAAQLNTGKYSLGANIFALGVKSAF
ncbi:MAG TPA: outer membrane protein transport protein [Gemmatimonadaceae bacterium]